MPFWHWLYNSVKPNSRISIDRLLPSFSFCYFLLFFVGMSGQSFCNISHSPLTTRMTMLPWLLLLRRLLFFCPLTQHLTGTFFFTYSYPNQKTFFHHKTHQNSSVRYTSLRDKCGTVRGPLNNLCR